MRSYVILAFFVVFFCVTYAQDEVWLNNEIPREERIDALISAMTLEEKAAQLMNSSPAIPRLNIPSYDWWNECLHGVARSGRATVFPQPICLAATFDDSLAKVVATAISDEARAKFTIAQAMGNRSKYAGLTFWTPNINIFRDPRWGRGQETYGEDPFLMSKMGVAFIQGLQGDDANYLKTAACAKHYVVHSGPEELRHEFNAVVTDKDLWETYMPAFEAAVKEGKVESIMGAYNRTNGESCSASPTLLNGVLRKQWGFKGHVVSDCGAVRDLYEAHALVKTPEEASALAIKSGLDLNCGSTFESMVSAVEKGLLAEEDINGALRNLLQTRFKLGLFDPVELNPYNAIPEEVIASKKHAQLSREVAQKGIVLVKNKNNVLPLDKNIRNVFVTGPQAANADVLLGNYYGLTNNTVNFLDGIVGRVSAGTTINYKYGQLPYQENVNPIDWTTGSAGAADACIAIMGINGMWEGEEGESIASSHKGDKASLGLPQSQINFLKKIRKRGNNPLIVVITGGSPIAIPEIMEFADAVLFAWYPGQEGGNALADILFGDVSPSGKLPFTVPYSVDDLPPFEDYNMAGRTYRYMEKTPEFTFGFGLSYGAFEFEKLLFKEASIKRGQDLQFTVDIVNNGTYVSEEVVQAYLVSPDAGKGQPISSLKGFKRVSVNPGQHKTVAFKLNSDLLKLVNKDGEKFHQKGSYRIVVGNASPGSRSKELGARFVEKEFVMK